MLEEKFAGYYDERYTIILGISCFVLIYGVRVLNPVYDDWLLRGEDLTQHYIGWEFYRASDWQFPIGLMDRIAYPNSVSVIFTDSIPIFALLFKILSPILPNTFQYFGWWGLLCFICQAVFAAKLLFLFTKNEKVSLLGSIFFVTAPILIARTFYHTALSSQWLLLAALYFGKKTSDLCGRGYNSVKQYTVIWGILGILCGSIHMYYVPMCGIIMCGFLLVRLIREKKLIPCLMMGASFCIGALTMIFLFGGLSHEHQLDAGGLGQFSFNMNGFINSMGWSKWLPRLSAYGEGSEDGFAYLGLGILGLIVIAFLFILVGRIHVMRKKYGKSAAMAQTEHTQKSAADRWKNSDVAAYVFIVVVCVLVSASHKFAWNGSHVWELPYPDKLVSLWGMFRSSGRFIWPVVYLLMLWAICAVAKGIKNKVMISALLASALLIQVYDISGVLYSKQKEFQPQITYSSRLQNEGWEEIAEGKEHIVFVSQVTQNQDILYGISQYAYLHGMTINDFYLAHSAAARDINSSREESLRELREDTIYIFKMQDEELCRQYDLQYQIMDDIIVGLKK